MSGSTAIWSPERCDLGEGPLTHHLRGSLVWCDINNARIYERPFDSSDAARVFDLPVMPSAAGIVDAGTILVATENDFRFLDLDSGKQTVHRELATEADLRANDGRVHPSGAFWIGTMAKDGRSRTGDIWRLFEGELTKLVANVAVPNSICFAADGSFAYFTDTPTRTIQKVATDPKDGTIVGEAEPFVVFEDDVAGGPDGSVVDGEGNLWNARWGGSAVDVYDRDGVRRATHLLPVRQPTCPSFIGANLDRVVTTSAAVGIEAVDGCDGAVIELNVPVVGREEPIVRP